LVELRDIARGIHPPALDVGLDAALATLVARSAIPATLHVDIDARPTQAIETIAYFSAAELLANAAKHSRARHAAVEVIGHGDWLRLRVTDDGVGGARPGAGRGTGLTGLTDRVHTVDGRLQVSSPHGGPTVITVVLPIRA
jgi:signal transduction histidine kinase